MPGSACHNDLTPSMGKRGLMSLAVAQRMRSLYTSLPEARPKAVLDSVRKQFGPVNVGLRAVRERKRMMRPGTSLGELAAAVAPHAVWPPLDSLHEGFFAHCLFPGTRCGVGRRSRDSVRRRASLLGLGGASGVAPRTRWGVRRRS